MNHPVVLTSVAIWVHRSLFFKLNIAFHNKFPASTSFFRVLFVAHVQMVMSTTQIVKSVNCVPGRVAFIMWLRLSLSAFSLYGLLKMEGYLS